MPEFAPLGSNGPSSSEDEHIQTAQAVPPVVDDAGAIFSRRLPELEFIRFRTLYLDAPKALLNNAVKQLVYSPAVSQSGQLKFHWLLTVQGWNADLLILEDTDFAPYYVLGDYSTCNMSPEKMTITFTERAVRSESELVDVQQRNISRKSLVWQEAAKIEGALHKDLSTIPPTSPKSGVVLTLDHSQGLILDHTFAPDEPPEILMTCAGTERHVSAALQDIAAQWRSDSRVYRLSKKAETDVYTIARRPRNVRPVDLERPSPLDLSHRDCGEVSLLPLPNGSVQVVFRAIQKASSINWPFRWQAALPLVADIISNLQILGVVELKSLANQSDGAKPDRSYIPASGEINVANSKRQPRGRRKSEAKIWANQQFQKTGHKPSMADWLKKRTEFNETELGEPFETYRKLFYPSGKK